jgi:hypothetical protein
MLELSRLKSLICGRVGILTVGEGVRDVSSIVLLVGVGGGGLIHDSLAHEAWLRLLCEAASVEFLLLGVLVGEAIGLKHLMTHRRVLSILLLLLVMMGVLMVVVLLNQQVLRWGHFITEAAHFDVIWLLLVLKLSLHSGHC